MDPIERKRQRLQAKQAARQARAKQDRADTPAPAPDAPEAERPAEEATVAEAAPPSPAPERATPEATEATPAAVQGEDGTEDERDTEAVRAKLALERELLELEREKLALERERLALEAARATEPVPPPAPPARPRRAAARASSSSARLRADAGEAPAGPAPRRRPRAAESPVLLAVLGGVLAFASIGALLYFFGDRSKLPMLGPEPGAVAVSPPAADPGPPTPSGDEPPPERTSASAALLEGLRQQAVTDPEAKLTLGLALWNGSAAERDPVAAEAWIKGAALTGQGSIAERATEALRRIAAQRAAGTVEPITDRELRAELARRAEARTAQQAAARERAARHEEERARREQARAAERQRELESARDQAPVLVDELGALEELEPLFELEPEVEAALAVLRDSAADAAQVATLEQARAAARRRVFARARDALRARLAAGWRLHRLTGAVGGLAGLAKLDPELAASWRELSAELEAEARRLQGAARAARAELARAALGGSAVSPALPIAAALDWLAAHQSPDGRWDVDDWATTCQGGRCVGPGTDAGDARYDVGLTGLALLAFLEGGQAAADGPYGETVARALAWLLAQQRPSGAIGFDHGETIYNHAIATKTLARALALGVSADPRLGEAAARALRFCHDAQNPARGWKYGIQTGRDDTSVTGWMVQALLAARGAGLEVRESALAGAGAWFRRATDERGEVGYETPGGGSAYLPQNDGKYDRVPCMTAVAVACRLALGEAETAPQLRSGLQHLSAALPTWAPHVGVRTVNFYYWYHGTLATQRTSLERTWRLALQQALIPNQRVGGCADGSWDGVGEWCLAGGRVYATAINALALAVGAAPAAAPPAPPAAPAGARVVVASKGGGPGPGVYLVRGRLRNEGGAPATGVQVTIALLDAEGRELFVVPAECAQEIAPGREADYSLAYRGEHVSLVHDFEVRATCAELEGSEGAPEEGPGAEPAGAASSPARGLSAEQLAEVEEELRQRARVWLRARSSAALRCYRCDLREQVACDPCGGDGRRNLRTSSGVYSSPCEDCHGRGVVACPDQGCVRGYRGLSLKRTFWEVLSPEARAAREREDFLREVAVGALEELIGPTPIVRDADVIDVEVGERAARVTARVRWGTAAAGTTEWTSTWIRARGRLYLATAEDRAPEPLVPR